MGVVSERVAAIVVELVEKTNCKGTPDADGQRREKIFPVHRIGNPWPDHVRKGIHGKDNKGGYYKVAEFHSVSRQSSIVSKCGFSLLRCYLLQLNYE